MLSPEMAELSSGLDAASERHAINFEAQFKAHVARINRICRNGSFSTVTHDFPLLLHYQPHNNCSQPESKQPSSECMNAATPEVNPNGPI